MNFFETVEARFTDWHYGHPRIIYSLIRSLKPQVVVEVGTYRSYAACYMAQALQENNTGHLYCIDNFSLTDHTWKYGDPEQHWHDNLVHCGVREWVTLLKGDSDKVTWPDKLDLAYIDGWHSYHAAKHDFDMCASRGAGFICLDDTVSCVGPRLLMQGVDRKEWSIITIPSDNGLSVCMRNEKLIDVTFSQELANNPGVDLTVLTPDQRVEHFRRAAAETGLDYRAIGV